MLEKKRGELCICFAPHCEMYVNQRLEIYAGQYILKVVYPFDKVIYFRSLLYEEGIDLSTPLCILDAGYLAAKGKYNLDELYAECSRVLTARGKTGAYPMQWLPVTENYITERLGEWD